MEFTGIKSTWRKIGNIIRADYIGSSYKICEVNVDMSYPATKEQGEANLNIILAAPEMLKACQDIVNADNVFKLAEAKAKCAKAVKNALTK